MHAGIICSCRGGINPVILYFVNRDLCCWWRGSGERFNYFRRVFSTRLYFTHEFKCFLCRHRCRAVSHPLEGTILLPRSQRHLSQQEAPDGNWLRGFLQFSAFRGDSQYLVGIFFCIMGWLLPFWWVLMLSQRIVAPPPCIRSPYEHRKPLSI